MGKPLKIGIVGVGNISSQYLANIPKLSNLELIGVTDLDIKRAEEVATKHNLACFSNKEIYSAPEIDAILNLTLPQSHTSVNLNALKNGKHVYLEKPFALSSKEANYVLALAKEKELRIGCAPDTFLGTGIQTSKFLIENGDIGTPFAASAFWSAPGHELWHPSPQFYYLNGAGPLFDMGPYYLTALVFLLGPVTSVIGNATKSNRLRKIHQGDSAGQSISVEVDTHISALLTHVSGAISTISVSFEVWGSRIPNIEIYGSKGTISVPDPNMFDGIPQILTESKREWVQVENMAGYVDAGRGIGLSEMADAINNGTAHRASGQLGAHVLEVMESILETSKTDSRSYIQSTVNTLEIVMLSNIS